MNKLLKQKDAEFKKAVQDLELEKQRSISYSNEAST